MFGINAAVGFPCSAIYKCVWFGFFSSAIKNYVSAVQSVLRDTSRVLESLSTSSGVQSFLLAVDPFNPSDGGFLGGSLVGREFWRGFRGGGETGARSFKIHSTAQLRSKDEHLDFASTQTTVPPQLSVPPAPKLYHAKSLKNELYESVRSALRCVISSCPMETVAEIHQFNQWCPNCRDEMDQPGTTGCVWCSTRWMARRSAFSEPIIPEVGPE